MKKFELMALPYAPEALEPVISHETIGFHHGKHLQAYVDNLNKLASPPSPSPIGEGSLGELEVLEEIVRKAPAGAVFNNAGQILNHEMYFLQFKPVGEAAQEPEGALAAQIEKQWGSRLSLKRRVLDCLALAGCGCRQMLMAIWLSRKSKGRPILW